MFSGFEFDRNDEAATAVEYAVLLALIILACFAAIANLGTSNANKWDHNQEELQRVM